MSAPAYALPEPVQIVEVRPPSHEEIAKLAYTIWQERGEASRSAEDDWLEAERWLLGQVPSEV